MNRADRRRITVSDLKKAAADIEASVTATFFSVWVDVLFDDGMTEDKIAELSAEVVERYNEIQDAAEYQRKVYEKTGIGIVKVD